MYELVDTAAQRLIGTRFDGASWEAIRAQASCGAPAIADHAVCHIRIGAP